jgi:hypothetical protein
VISIECSGAILCIHACTMGPVRCIEGKGNTDNVMASCHLLDVVKTLNEKVSDSCFVLVVCVGWT